MATNKAAYLRKAGTTLDVADAPLPTAGPNELVIANAAVAINPLDFHMQDQGVFVQQWPSVLGCDVAGIVHEVGAEVNGRFKVGDRVIGHTINLVTGRPQDGAYALFTTVPADKAALLPDSISFTEGVVVPFALEAAVCALSITQSSEIMPGVTSPALGLPYPSLEPSSLGKTIIVYGGSSSVGSMTTQIATATGIDVIAIASTKNFDLCKTSGAVDVYDYHDASFVGAVVSAAKKLGHPVVGIFDAISSPETYENSLVIIAALGGGHLACSHPPPAEVPDNVKAGMIFAVNDIATPVWKDFVTPALEARIVKCLPTPTVVGKGLEKIQEGLDRSKAGVSATKLVIEI